MKRIIELVFILCIVFGSTTGCKTIQSVAQTTSDSTHTEVRVEYRDTTLYVPGKTITKTIYNPCPNGVEPVFDVVEETNNPVSVKATANGKNIDIECKVDTQAIIAKVKDTYETKIRELSKENTKVITTNEVNGFVKFLAWSGGIVWGLLILAVIVFALVKGLKIGI